MSFDNLAKVLAVLVAEQGSYTYVDKLGYVPSKDLAVFYLKEALRDLHSIQQKEKFENEKARELVGKIDYERVEKELEDIAKTDERKELREKTSLIAAKALALSAKLGGGSGE
ncbi:type I-A CRISPR-associated protein Csa5 [Archaeoglobus fulgidus]|jgi:CRISPR-associated protein Csa5|nr:type I-A CRISPR-associated protein Csa5 [Archaeoglobus fulgidus]AIG98868.1 CRISPR type I-A/APERN-associated protein Csa5 [Archaeoglobus fulgidus DSM 8774]